jgi:uncharacterized FlaG/YvyC family protein
MGGCEMFLTPLLGGNPPTTQFVEKTENVQSKAKNIISKTEPVKDDKLKSLQNSLAEHNITLKFRQDEETKQLVVELVDDKTGEAIRQIPSEVSLKLSRLSVKLHGQLVDENV